MRPCIISSNLFPSTCQRQVSRGFCHVDTSRLWRYHPGVPRQATKILVVLALSSVIGLHWVFLQSIAWVTMAVTYSRTAPLKVAITKTFDGKNPCTLCHFVTKGKQTERKAEFDQLALKLEFVPQVAVACIDFPVVEPSLPGSRQASPSRPESPPVPPPRPA